MSNRKLPRNPVKVRSTGHVFFPLDFVTEYDMTASQYEWAEDSEKHQLRLIPVEHGKKMQSNRSILLPIKIASRYVGSYDLEKTDNAYILVPINNNLEIAPKPAVCPFCEKTYDRPPALSRVDGRSLICPDCGIREALSTIGVEPEEQEKIVAIIHENTQKY